MGPGRTIIQAIKNGSVDSQSVARVLTRNATSSETAFHAV